ncbi:MAG: phage N-6-adenine-methyltransferase [Pantoea sp.]|uniref:phage N-6-adenine-methyltransferase n=1 Tax=Pantoea sp. TaxID=69393 RepID=UPI0039E69096
MIYGSVCSGIEAATVAWQQLGWKAAWFSEIEAFPCAVLATRWPEITNLGDMTKIAAKIRAGEVEAPDVLAGGTPCQSYSIAGLRAGLSDPRGQLTLAYVDLFNAIDEKRITAGKPEAICIWENVPGVLNSKDNAFGCFLAGLAGESSELQPSGGKWTNAGCVYGPQRVVAWRVLDAQFFGVAQRRRRVFVVASARNGFDPAAVLFEFESLRRDTPPSREKGKAVAALTANGVGVRGADDNQGQAGHLITQHAFGGGNTSGEIDVAACLTAKGQRIDFDVETFAVHGTQDPDTNTNLAHTLGRNHGQENAVMAFSYKDHGADVTDDLSPTLRAGNHDKSHANSGQPPAICIQHATIGRKDEAGPQGKGYQVDVVQHGLHVRRLTPVECERLQGFPDNHTLIPFGRSIRPEKMEADYAKYLMRGGNLSFDECLRAAADGPRYRAIGNSMAVPVMRWIGEAVASQIEKETVNPYCQALNEQRKRSAHMLKEVGDQWRTPDALWWGINAKFGPFVLDLFADDHNAKCPDYYTAEDNSLSHDWSERLKALGGAAYANPPYSRATKHNGEPITGMVHIMAHTAAMREKGGRYVYLIKAATSESWWPENADHIAFIRGRIGFDLPEWFVPADEKQRPAGAFFAGAIAVFDKSWTGPAMSYISRDELESMGRMFMDQIQSAASRLSGVAA